MENCLHLQLTFWNNPICVACLFCINLIEGLIFGTLKEGKTGPSEALKAIEGAVEKEDKSPLEKGKAAQGAG